jgi:hypothetical protein
MAIRDLDDVNTGAFVFSDLGILDTNMNTVGQGQAADFPAQRGNKLVIFVLQ